jgi:hypothetical protein
LLAQPTHIKPRKRGVTIFPQHDEIRFRFARAIIRLGLWFMPDCQKRREIKREFAKLARASGESWQFTGHSQSMNLFADSLKRSTFGRESGVPSSASQTHPEQSPRADRQQQHPSVEARPR